MGLSLRRVRSAGASTSDDARSSILPNKRLETRKILRRRLLRLRDNAGCLAKFPADKVARHTAAEQEHPHERDTSDLSGGQCA